MFGFRVSEGPEVIGIYDGYPGLYENRMKQPDRFSVSDVINGGGTFPGAACFSEFRDDFRDDKVRETAIENLSELICQK